MLDGALGVLGDDVDEALVNEVEAAMSPATVLLRAKRGCGEAPPTVFWETPTPRLLI